MPTALSSLVGYYVCELPKPHETLTELYWIHFYIKTFYLHRTNTLNKAIDHFVFLKEAIFCMKNHGFAIVFKSTGVTLQVYVLKEGYKNIVVKKWEGKASNCIELLQQILQPK